MATLAASASYIAAPAAVRVALPEASPSLFANSELGKKILAQRWFVDEKGPWHAAQESAHERLLQSLAPSP